MIQETHNFITVPQAIRESGRLPIKRLCWTVGSRMAAWHRREHGSQPNHGNRKKTNLYGRGGGSHCFDLYQPKLRYKILEFAEEVEFEWDRQMWLWDDFTNGDGNDIISDREDEDEDPGVDIPLDC